jgi:hypothetical protein
MKFIQKIIEWLKEKRRNYYSKRIAHYYPRGATPMLSKHKWNK